MRTRAGQGRCPLGPPHCSAGPTPHSAALPACQLACKRRATPHTPRRLMLPCASPVKVAPYELKDDPVGGLVAGALRLVAPDLGCVRRRACACMVMSHDDEPPSIPPASITATTETGRSGGRCWPTPACAPQQPHAALLCALRAVTEGGGGGAGQAQTVATCLRGKVMCARSPPSPLPAAPRRAQPPPPALTPPPTVDLARADAPGRQPGRQLGGVVTCREGERRRPGEGEGAAAAGPRCGSRSSTDWHIA